MAIMVVAGGRDPHGPLYGNTACNFDTRSISGRQPRRRLVLAVARRGDASHEAIQRNGDLLRG